MTQDQTQTKPNRRGLLIILSSPSGAGKSTLAKQLMAWDPSIRFSVSATTRAPRPGEVDGKDYYFLSEAEFKSRVADGGMLEHAHVFGNFYGSPKAAVEEAINDGQDILFDIDWQGARQVKEALPDTCGIFILPPSLEVLNERLNNRGQDSQEVIAGRMSKAVDEMIHYDEFDHLIINDDFETALDELHGIVTAQRVRTIKQSMRHSSLITELTKKP